MTSRGSGRALAVPLSIVLVWGVLLWGASACQSSPGEESAPGGDPTSPSASEASSAPPELPEPTPTVEPADGPLIDVPGATMRGLKTYTRLEDYGHIQLYRDSQSGVTVASVVSEATSLDAYAKEFRKGYRGKGVTKRYDDAVVGGHYMAWHMEDEDDPKLESHLYGVMYLDAAWLIDITFANKAHPRPLTQEERDEVTASLLATFKPHRENG